MADPATAFDAFKACLDQIPASGSRAYTIAKDFQPLIAAAVALLVGVAAWIKLREDRRVAELADREKKKALYWLAHTEAGIGGYNAETLKKEIDKWIEDHPAEDAVVDAGIQRNWQLQVGRLASEEYEMAYQQLSVFPLAAFDSIRMLNAYNQNLRILASDTTIPGFSAKYLSYLLNDVIKYSSDLEKVLAPLVANFTWKERKL
ncbi:hypothetical protein [Bradyrhizobium commune]|uniref:DUF4760 domain-containing protein n=1 Tax=Bradyrhizobium commune TaxID=83627 RepID=A0A7S9D9L1_9BRAD|nr:hypothetical protein [Bradyrhizobium commune]QPF93752.1 hypothetical protein IC761_11000 [Bradyrhizobium commune]